MGRLNEKIAVVVGAGQTPGETIGNGRATALRFAGEGANEEIRAFGWGEATHDLRQFAGGEFAASTSAVTELCESTSHPGTPSRSRCLAPAP